MEVSQAIFGRPRPASSMFRIPLSFSRIQTQIMAVTVMATALGAKTKVRTRLENLHLRLT